MIEYQAATDTFRDGNDDQIAQAFGSTTETDFGKCTGICSVFQFHRQPSGLFERCFQVEVFPAEVGRKDQLLARQIDATRQAHTDTFARQFRPRCHQLTNARHQFGDKLLWICVALLMNPARGSLRRDRRARVWW